ncbi:aminopeptidase [Tetragenococcus muriaticus]|uniref:Aminopeptidase n=2 Tax=Tetragenococcus muriaticus TaxID=64642 RepID=A0A091C7E4_9ENTE|nr:aminopeptidase [Tetragenococcus muriaticus]KFN92032.1 aminopeptidase [Tetragenococcus muriaticus 3MR10-3]KFN92664.1 aminopeptidase [Tetragenococcus muriaticus PMC-11-5]GMA47609.1 aminopeptidase [Tetragenococcus muriaticus]
MDLAKFEENLNKYAQLIVEVGINVQQSHTVVLQISVEQAQLARLITKKAYELKAAEVIVEWSDEEIQKEFLTNAAFDRIQNFPQYKIQQANEWIEKGASRISVISSDPQALADVDSQRVAAYQKAAGKGLINLRKATQSNKVSWTVVAAAGENWAKRVFPELSTDEAVKTLWEEIFKTTRVDRKDPIAAWKEHDEALEKKADTLNQQQFAALHYQAPGTDLTIGLPENHLWEGAGSFNSRGEKFIANMPTEEVFTAPDSQKVNGVIASTKPLSYAGTIISGMKFTFENGKVVDFSAEKGQDVLEQLLETDEGAKYLGEVALVPDPSPISQSGIIFFNTLFDENASNHLALGSAYAFNLQGGTEMDEQELEERGLNSSQTHVDFMVGSNQMSIDGIKKDGTVIPVFRNGDWA